MTQILCEGPSAHLSLHPPLPLSDHTACAGEIYNIGTDVEFTNLQLAEYLLRHYKLEECQPHTLLDLK